MKRRILLTLAAAATLLAGCSKESGGEDLDTPWNGEIRLASGVTVQSRANNGDVPDKQIADRQKVQVVVKEQNAAAGATYGYDLTMTADGEGGLSNADTKMYYPESGKGVSIYAYHPASAEEAFTVLTNQSSDAAYYNSDLLYSAKANYERQKDAHALTFEHRLSKLTYTLVSGTGSPDLTGAKVEWMNVCTKADFDKATGGVSNPTTPAATITPHATYGAIVVPQTTAANARLLKVTLASGGVFYYAPAAQTFEGGKKYHYQITVNLTGLTVTSTIKDWEPVGPIDGEAEMAPPIGDKTPDQAALYDFYMSDGSLVDSQADLTAEQKAACIGVVYWVGNPTDDTNGDPLLKVNYPSCAHGLVVALHDAGNSLWCDSYEDITNSWLSKQDNTYGITSLKITDKMQGYANTRALIGYNASDRVSGNSRLKVLPIEVITTTYAAAHPAPASSSGWYWPSIMELKYMCWGQGTISQSTAGREFLNAQLGKVSGTPLQSDNYWSSSEYSNDSGYAWYVDFDSGNVYYYGYKFYYTYRVRPLLAF